MQKRYSSDLDEDLTLTIGGPYKYSRHPIYFFSIMFLLFRPTMDLFYLTFFVLIVAYFYIGSYYEEKKMVKSFGEIYTNYQKSVSQIFPSIPLRAYNAERFAES
jgi:protein-S-isoprenylcysteine O-methyltransferase Ste14